MTFDKISIPTARNLMLAAQGLSQLPAHPTEKRDVLEIIRKMGVLQIDTIHVVARSPYLVLWSRLGDYPMSWLDELLAEGALFEFWSHAMDFIPIEDYPLYRRSMLDGLRGWGDAKAWVEKNQALVVKIMDRIRSEGGLRSSDFDNDHKPAGGWWSWKDEKIALECLIVLGDLMVARRQGFQKVYDLRERVLPGWDDGPDAANVPSREEVWRALTLQTVKALGVARADWVPDYFRLPKKGNLSRLEALAAEGLLQMVEIEGLPGPAYLHPEACSTGRAELTTFLSPFDPLIWDRKRLRELFGFDYTIECYTPVHKRRFGYYTMAILHHGAVIGRLDPKTHRADGLFEVKALAFEPGVEITDELIDSLSCALHRFAAWHSTPEVVIGRTDPVDLAALLSK